MKKVKPKKRYRHFQFSPTNLTEELKAVVVQVVIGGVEKSGT